MLNPAFSKSVTEFDDHSYTINKSILNQVSFNNLNYNFQKEKEYRLEKVYNYEILLKLERLGVTSNYLENKIILDICSGKGFLSYHLLKDFCPKKLVLLDISKSEVFLAKKLLINEYSQKSIESVVNDAMNTAFKNETFDLIIGNSFLHHFYNIPKAITEIYRILKKGGVFISLHEPTSAVVAFENGSVLHSLIYLLIGERYVDIFRYNGEGVARGGGEDIWLLNEENINNILLKSGMKDISIKHFHLFRSLYVGKFKVHLSENKPYLSKRESLLLKKCIDWDLFLSHYLPQKMFGSIAIIAKK